MTYYIISTRQRPSALHYSRELPSKATKPSNMAEPLGSSCSRRGRGLRRAPRPARPRASAPAYLLRTGWASAGCAPCRMGPGHRGRAGSRAGPCCRPRARPARRAQALPVGRAAGGGGSAGTQTHFWVTAATGGSTLIPSQKERVGTLGRGAAGGGSLPLTLRVLTAASGARPRHPLREPSPRKPFRCLLAGRGF